MQETKVIPITKDQIVETAQKMRDSNEILVMIHGYYDKDGTPVITYDFGTGEVLSEYEVRGEKVLPTITHIYSKAAEWPERELMELMDVTFEGCPVEDRLFLPDNLLSGKGQILVSTVDELKKQNDPDYPGL